MNTPKVSAWYALVAVCATVGASGCASLQYGCDLPAIPAHRVPLEAMARPRADMQQISITRLRQNPPEVYQLGPNDILGIHIPFVLGKEDEPPVVHFPEQGDQPPALGFPIPIREDGTLALPLINPVNVMGLTLAEAQDKIRAQYVADMILKEGQEKIVVTLIRRRMYRVSVIREETGNAVSGGLGNGLAIGSTKRGTGETIDLPAYENDVLHALNLTGGLPGLDAKNEIYILRGGSEDAARRDEIIAQLKAAKHPCDCPCPAPPDPTVTMIPIRFYPEQLPQFTEEDIILKTGDIIYIPTREREIFYTGGALGGGSYPLPRDYDIDVLGAVALAGGPVGSAGTGVRGIGGQGGGGFGGGGRTGLIPPSNLIIIRKLPCGGQIPISVNLNRALVDPAHRILIAPEDTLVLRYTFEEEILNLATGLFQINYLLGSGLRN